MSTMGPLSQRTVGGFAFLGALSVRLRLGGSAVAGVILLAGCQGTHSKGFLAGAAAAILAGEVHGGQQPVVGASIQLYAAGTTGDGSAALPLIAAVVKTDPSGQFDLTGMFACPTLLSEVYLVASGGDPGLGNGGSNPQSVMMTALGPCGDLSALPHIEVNEVTTVAATYALAGYLTSYRAIGSDPGHARMMADAFTMASELANITSGRTPGTDVPTGQVVPSQKLNELADILSECVDSDGGVAGDSSDCGRLFSLASAGSNVAPTDTVGALLAIAHSPTINVVPLFNLDTPIKPFQPSLASAPADWTIAITSSTPTPLVFPVSGIYVVPPLITLSDNDPFAAIYYTVDGATPTSSSIGYTGAFVLSGSASVRAVAIAGGISSLLAAGTYAVAAPTIALTPASITLSSSQTQAFTAMVSGSSNPAVIWSLNPSIGTISAVGLYTAPPSIVSTQAITVTATSVADHAVSTEATVTLASSPISVALTPGSLTLTASETQAFTATVGGTSNTAVTWSLSPNIGSISPAGLYAAPATILDPITVTLTSTSVADSTKSASSRLSLSSSIPASLFGLTVLDFSHLTPSIQFGTTRSWDSSPNLDWSDANPAAGIYNFTSLDQFIATNQARGADVIYTFGRTPQWASSQPNAVTPYGPGQCAPPADMSTWDSYVTAVVTHAAGRIKYWELWNEPTSPYSYCGDMPTMITMAQHAARIIKSIDPTALILSPSVVGASGYQWLGPFLASGGAASVDVVAFHGYLSAQAEEIVSVISSLSTTASANGAAGKPIWDTESSWADNSGTQPTPSTERQVAFIAKDYLLHWSQGVPRFVWYAYDGGPVWGGLLPPGGTESTAVVSYKQTYKWMVGATLTAPCSEGASHVWTCTLSRTGGYRAEAIWISNNTAIYPVPAQYVEYRDLSGVVHPITGATVSIGDQPILLETAPLP